MNDDLIDALIQLGVAVVAMYWWWRSEYWKERAKAAEGECADLEKRAQRSRMCG